MPRRCAEIELRRPEVIVGRYDGALGTSGQVSQIVEVVGYHPLLVLHVAIFHRLTTGTTQPTGGASDNCVTISGLAVDDTQQVQELEDLFVNVASPVSWESQSAGDGLRFEVKMKVTNANQAGEWVARVKAAPVFDPSEDPELLRQLLSRVNIRGPATPKLFKV